MSLPGTPIFAAPDGTLYDIMYRLLSHARMPELERAADSIPSPFDFSSFEAYENALLEWKRNVTTALGVLRLPQIVGSRCFAPDFSRPTVCS